MVARLLSESRKAGMRVLLVCQRADATVIGGFERGQASHAISFRVDADGQRMLHRDADPATVAAHAVADPGIGLRIGARTAAHPVPRPVPALRRLLRSLANGAAA